MLIVATAAPPGVYRNSASRPRLPTRITLLTLPMRGDLTLVRTRRRSGRGRCGRSRSELSESLTRETRRIALGIRLHDVVERHTRFLGAPQRLQRDAFL